MQNTIARTGDFIKLDSPIRKSLGLVLMVDEEIGQMYVAFGKSEIGRAWVLLDNRGQYIVLGR
tara:strand:- start:39 stop:227 length:189 start_codon:yes stop_codon:yes gene_type:complete